MGNMKLEISNFSGECTTISENGEQIVTCGDLLVQTVEDGLAVYVKTVDSVLGQIDCEVTRDWKCDGDGATFESATMCEEEFTSTTPQGVTVVQTYTRRVTDGELSGVDDHVIQEDILKEQLRFKPDRRDF